MKRIAFFVVAAMLAITVRAAVDETFDFEGLTYRITSETDRTVAVERSFVSGDVIIPPVVTGNGTEYAVTSIGQAAFLSCMELVGISIPESVVSIGNSAFMNCFALESVTIPSAVTSIDAFAFFYCKGLKEITIPKSVAFIGDQAFAGCSSMTDIKVEDGNEYFSSYSGVLYDFQKSVLLRCPLAKRIFAMPPSVTSIGFSAFSGCTGIISINIPETVTSIGDYAFSGCSGLMFLHIPESVAFIGSGAFNLCSGLTEITLPNSLTSIKSDTFQDCSGLTFLHIPESVTFIGSRAFNQCSGLTEMVLPTSVTFIGSAAFNGCIALESVVIPEGVGRLDAGTFMGCERLTKIVVMNPTPPDVDPYTTDGAFDGVPADVVVYIPGGSLDDYRTADGWSWVGYEHFHEMGVIDITLNYDAIELKPGETADIAAIVEPDWDMTVEAERWSSSNAKVAALEWSGSTCRLTAVNPGEAVVYYTVIDGYGAPHTRSCAVTVSKMSAADEVAYGQDSANADVYTLQGVAVLRNADSGAISGLAPGIYIVRRGTAVTKVAVR